MQGNPILNIGNNPEQQQQPLSQQPPVRVSQTCSIRPGAILYRAVENGFGNSAVLVVQCGQATEDFSTKQFDYKFEQSSCYLIENQTQVFDSGKLDEKKTLRLIRVSSPFVGSFFVQESNIMPNVQYTKNHGNRSLLRG